VRARRINSKGREASSLLPAPCSTAYGSKVPSGMHLGTPCPESGMPSRGIPFCLPESMTPSPCSSVYGDRTPSPPPGHATACFLRPATGPVALSQHQEIASGAEKGSGKELPWIPAMGGEASAKVPHLTRRIVEPPTVGSTVTHASNDCTVPRKKRKIGKWGPGRFLRGLSVTIHSEVCSSDVIGNMKRSVFWLPSNVTANSHCTQGYHGNLISAIVAAPMTFGIFECHPCPSYPL